MKKIIYIAIVLTLLLSGCDALQRFDQSETITPGVPTITAAPPEETPDTEPTPIPKVIEPADTDFESVSIDNDIITLDLPSAFKEADTKTGQIYSSQGFIHDDGNHYDFHILRFYQAEDENTSIAQLLDFDESMESYKYSSNIEYTNIMNNMPFKDAVGHLSKIEIGNDEKYTVTLFAEDTYYKFVLYSTGDLSGEIMAIRILTSIQVNGAKALKQSSKFNLNIHGQTYYSSKLEGAAIFVPEGWYPAESMYFSLENSILSLMSETMEGTATVRYYPKDKYPELESYYDFCMHMRYDLVSRGFLSEGKVNLVETFNPGEINEFYMFPSDIVIMHFNYEYEDAFFCVELIYSGIDAETTAQLMEIGESLFRE